jgi:ADP-dependent NAD(P)H-hydrate dehydratase / NAD(P)H-hydrate epimerase
MRHAHAVPAVRAAEHALMATVPEGMLMQRAAAGLAAACTSLLDRVYGARVVVLAGSGDNGGDALFAGARLARRGARVTTIATGSQLHEGGLAALRAAGGLVVAATADDDGNAVTVHDGSVAGAAGASDRRVAAEALSAIASADLILDGLTGIGGSGGLREPAATLAGVVELAREEGSMVVAVDLPSGVDASTGEVQGAAIRADVTITFGTWKPGLLIDPGSELAGATRLVDIGLGRYLPEPKALALQSGDVAALLPRPTPESDKYRRGVLGLLAGSDQYTGAAALATGAAIHGGAGAVRLVTAPSAVQVVRQRWPEALLTEIGNEAAPQLLESAGRVQAWVAGPGMGTDQSATARLAAVLATELPVLVDADGITILAANPGLLPRAAPTLITPHSGELARLLHADRADIEARRLHYATDAAAKLGVTVLLKGSTTIIAGPEEGRPVFVNPTGTSWLATAGSGDVLSGLTGSLLAQGLLAAEAAAVGAYLHGLAARIAADDAPIGAGDLIGALPEATRTVAESA